MALIKYSFQSEITFEGRYEGVNLPRQSHSQKLLRPQSNLRCNQ